MNLIASLCIGDSGFFIPGSPKTLVFYYGSTSIAKCRKSSFQEQQESGE